MPHTLGLILLLLRSRFKNLPKYNEVPKNQQIQSFDRLDRKIPKRVQKRNSKQKYKDLAESSKSPQEMPHLTLVSI